MSFVYHGALFLENKPKVDGGECARLIQNLLPWVGHTSRWQPGENVIDVLASGRQIEQGTAIATFVDGRYPTYGHRHAALFLWPITSCTFDPKTGQCKIMAIKMMDQWNPHPGAHFKKDHISSRDVLPYGKNAAAWPISDNASMFYIIE
ncbi:BPSL0067 family protein [Massilia horti]|uniref:BPSL0067 family protein n=1 Tax=Massilia horti TaxID=2562153 RepID=A0A4Y9SSN5_9BURK|nr:BPSL0067 family protein [Massilia horti]TFW27756.1 hypothetical protein E4O92_23125 [Massilia horti]